ncbi:MAG: ankyrin repeat domain-containing protein [Chloroflexota bacterium]
MKKFSLCGSIVLCLLWTCLSVVPGEAAPQGTRAGTVDVGTYEVRIPPDGRWDVTTDPAAESVRLEKVEQHPAQAGKTASAISIQVLRVGTETDKWGLSEEKVAEGYFDREETRTKDELVKGTGHEMKFFKKGTSTIAKKKVYSMNYRAEKPEVTVDAAIYLYFPGDYKKNHVFFVFFVSDAYAKDVHAPDLKVVEPVIASLKMKETAFPKATLQKELLKAVDENKVDRVADLLGMGADVNGTNADGWSALMVASSKGRKDLVKLLLDRGARANAKTPQGQTPIMFAVHWGHEDVVKLLLDRGAEVDAQMTDGWTALIDAAQMDKVAVAKLLIEHGAQVNRRSNTGWTALMAASFNNRPELLKLLIEKGADVNARDDQGKTALGVAKSKGHSEIVKILTEAGGTE